MPNPRRLWCFTINNPTQGNLDALRLLTDRKWTTWSVWQWEVGQQGTVHIQGALRTDPKKRRTAVSKLLTGTGIVVRAAHCLYKGIRPLRGPCGAQWQVDGLHSTAGRHVGAGGKAPHLEPMRGSPKDSVVYCSKADSRMSQNDLQMYLTEQHIYWQGGEGPHIDGNLYTVVVW